SFPQRAVKKTHFVKAGYVCPFLEKNSHFIFIKFKNLEEKAKKNEIINFPEPRSRVYFLFWQRLFNNSNFIRIKP
ncbi:hypothetical protein M4A92_17165, partial [Caldibacillus thermoamylovorans]|uniref:hypothetical protein n=1 Tax=Caldibacillus thermoamylovorans TaxID=35841 RepID=UPI00203EE972